MTQPWWPEQPTAPAARTQPSSPSAAGQATGGPVPAQASPWMPPPVPGQPGSQPTAQIPAGQPQPVQATGDIGAVLPGIPAPPAQQASVPGLGFATFLLVLGALAFGFFIVQEWVTDWALGIDDCLQAGGAWECVVNDAGRQQVLLPVIAIFAAFCLARGAGVERRQGRAIGFLYTLLGFGVLGLAWSMGSGVV